MEKIKLNIYLPTRPPLSRFENKRVISNIKYGEVPGIIAETGNHWRKIFSILSKISYQLNHSQVDSWQNYRDEVLLTSKGREKILFSTKIKNQEDGIINIISGNSFSQNFDLPLGKFKPIDPENKILEFQGIFLTPYFDYRQFPNALINLLVERIKKVTI